MSDKKQPNAEQHEKQSKQHKVCLWIKRWWFSGTILVGLAIAFLIICLPYLSPEHRITNDHTVLLWYLGSLAVTCGLFLCLPKIVTSNTKKYFITRVLTTGITGGVFALLLPIAVKSTTTGVGGLRHSILLATGGLLAILTLGETRRKNDIDKHKNDQEKDKNDKDYRRQVRAERRERYTKAIEQLGDDEKASVRMGGVYTLVGLVDEWLEDESIEKYKDRLKEGQVIINNLCAYIRSPFTLASQHGKLSQNKIKSKNKFKKFIRKYIQRNFYINKANFQAEVDVRLSIIKEIHDRLKGPEENTPGAWSDFEYDFSGSTFFYPVDFTNSYYKKPVNFRNSTYLGRADFKDSTYEGRAYFRGSTYKAGADFKGSIYQEGANFSGSTYQGRTYFIGSTYKAGADFSGSVYQWANFSGSTYQEWANFSGSTYQWADFSGSVYQWANFSGSTYQEWADFSGSTYKAGADLRGSTYQGRANFRGSTYQEWADFSGSTYQKGVNFRGSTYQEWANFSGSVYQWADFSGSIYQEGANFSGSIYQEGANFRGSVYQWANFSGSTYQGRVNFRGSTYQGRANFSGSTYQGRANFSGSTYQRRAYFGGSTYQGQVNFSGSIFYSKTYFGKDGHSKTSSCFTNRSPQFYDETNHKNTLFGSYNNDFTVDTNKGYPIGLNKDMPLDCELLNPGQKNYLKGVFHEMKKINNKILETKGSKENAEILEELRNFNKELHEWREEATTVKMEDVAVEDMES